MFRDEVEVLDMLVREMLDKHGEEIWNEMFKDFVSVEDLGFGDREVLC